jgi:hypothetical protein
MKTFTMGCLLGLVFLGTTSAFAGNIVLNENHNYGLPTGYAVNFNGTDGGSSFNLNFTSNAFGGAKGFGSLGSTGVYTILQNSATVNYTGTSCGTGCYSLTQVGNLVFDYGTVKNSGTLLNGYLQLLNVTQTGVIGNFNDMLMVNLIVNGGSLASKFGGGIGVVELTIAFKSATSLASLMTGQTLNSWIQSGTVNPVAVPEPASLLILGAGLISFVVLARKKHLSVG